MKTVGSYEAKTHLPRLLSQVEQGETIMITKRGKPVAVLSPARPVPQRDVKAVIAEFRAYSQKHGLHARIAFCPRNQGDDRGGTALSKKKGVAKPPKEGLVIDSSIAIAWCFPDERDTYSQSVLNVLASRQAIVPDLWHLEVANTLIVGDAVNALHRPTPSRGLAFSIRCRSLLTKRRKPMLSGTP